MKVLVLTSTFPDSPENIRGIFVKEQANTLAVEHDVCVIRLSINYKHFHPFFHAKTILDTSFGYPVYRITVSKSIPIFNQLNYLFSAYWSVKRIVSSYKPDLLHCHYSYPCGIIASQIKRVFKIPYVTTEHTRIKTTFRSIFHKKLSLFAMKQASRMIAVSNSLKNEIIAEGIHHTVVIPNVIPIKNFAVKPRSKDPFVIGFMGWMNTQNKRLDILFKACLKLPFSFKIKIGGAGAYFEYYKKLSRNLGLEKNCDFKGAILSNVNPAFYDDLSVFVLTSDYETFGIVLVEAMAAGIPVVATKCGGPLDIVSETTGILIDPNSPEQLTYALTMIYNNYHSYDSMNISNYATKGFSEEPFMEKMNALYNELIPKLT